MRRADAPGSWLPDVLGAALAVAFLTFVTHHFAPQPGERALDALGYGLLAPRRRRARPLPAPAGRGHRAGDGRRSAAYIVREYPGGPIFVTAGSPCSR